MRILTIGFTKKGARGFFGLLRDANVKRVIDVRLNNVSQLAGFAKKKDLEFFLEEIGNIDYVHVPLLAPTKELLDDYKKRGGDWAEYEKQFVALMKKRDIEHKLSPDLFDQACLLCSEHEPDQCHRRLVAEYLSQAWPSVEIQHLY